MAWNRPTSNTVDATSSSRPSGRGKMPRLRRGLIAGVIVVLGAGLAAWLLTNGEAASSPLQKKDHGLIKEVTPVAAAPTNALPAKPIDPREDYDHTKMYRDEKGILRLNSGCRAYDPTVKRAKPFDASALSRPDIFSNECDCAIASLLRINPGGLVGVRKNYYDPELEAEYMASITTPIRINDDDPEGVKQLKQGVIDVRREIAERIGSGEKLGDILTSAENELRRLSDYRHSLEGEVADIIEKGDMSTDDVKDIVKAANQMFEKEGLAPLNEDSFVIWNIRLEAEKRGEDPEASVEKYKMQKEEMK